MIIDLERFLAGERRYWDEMEAVLARLENDPGLRLTLDEAQRLHYLYERTLADLARIATFAAEPEIRRYLESLVARSYGEIHETRERGSRLSPWRWFFQTFPKTFRRHASAFWLSVAITVAGAAFGCLALAIDPAAKQAIMPFSGLGGDPRERVKQEESAKTDRLAGRKTAFSAQLMTHNTQVAVFTAGLGMTWGAGTAVLLFYNGVILGAVAWDYVLAGQGRFLLGWLLPHGSIEIPSILLAGQAGFVLASALIGWGKRTSRAERLRTISPDVATLLGGAACMLVWAGLVEAFLSQYHQPVIPYALKIGLGLAELVLLTLFLSKSGSAGEHRE